MMQEIPQQSDGEQRNPATPVEGWQQLQRDSATQVVVAEPARINVQSNPGSAGPAGRSWGRDLIVSIAISVFIILFLYQPVRVEGTSMLPVLEDQDRLFINKFAYKVGDIHRDDVVVFLYPRDHSKSYIKRVIGLPGDDIRIDHGQVYVNHMPIKETYVPSKYEDDRSEPELVVPAGQYFVMGDHRSISSDSRDFGTVDRKLVFGRAAFVYWPMDQAGVVR